MVQKFQYLIIIRESEPFLCVKRYFISYIYTKSALIEIL